MMSGGYRPGYEPRGASFENTRFEEKSDTFSRERQYEPLNRQYSNERKRNYEPVGRSFENQPSPEKRYDWGMERPPLPQAYPSYQPESRPAAPSHNPSL